MDVRYRFNEFTVDPVRRLLFGPEGQTIPLKPRVFDTLLFLIEHRGELLEKQTLLDAIWPHVVVEENNLNQAISALRRVLGETRDDHRFIVTEPGRGYRFVAPVESLAPNVIPAPEPRAAALSAPLEPKLPARRTRVGGVALSSLAVATAGALAWLSFGPEVGTDPDSSLGPLVRAAPITAYLGNELAPTLSPTGDSVAFSRDDEGGNRNLYVARIGGTGAAQLTDSAEPDRFPAWSPNGADIAFLRQTGVNSFDLIVVPALGGRERLIRTIFIRPSDIHGSPPLAWTPTSDALVFTTRTDDDVSAAHHLYRLTLATGETVQLTTGDNVYDTSPAISADGRWLAFVRHTDFLTHARGELIVQPLADAAGVAESIVVPVLNTGAETAGDAVHSLSWSADGRYLTFVAGVNLLEWALGAPAIRLVYAGMGTLGGGTSEGDISALTMVRNGGNARAVVASIDRTSDIYALPLSASARDAMGPPVLRIGSSAGDVDPHFSPDGTRIAFLSNRDGATDVWIAAADGSNPWRLTDLQSRIVGFARWSPDGKRIAFHSLVGTERQLFIVDPDAGVPERLANGCCAHWSPDGQHLYVTDVRANHTLSRARVADGRVEPLFPGGFATVTADGSTLLYGKLGEQNIYARAIAGDLRSNAEETLVTDSAYPPSIAVTAEGLFLVSDTPGGRQPLIRFYSYETREARTIARLPGRGIETLTLSPDGTELLYASQAESGADLVLLEFAR